MKTYDITVTREGKWWMVDVPAIDGLTQARRLSEIKTMAVSLIAVTLDVPASQVAVNVVAIFVDGTDLVQQRLQIEAERKAAREAERKAAALTVELVHKLDADHVPLRDIGEAVGCPTSESTNYSGAEDKDEERPASLGRSYGRFLG